MTFNAYQQFTATTAIYPNRGIDLTYPTLGLCGEAGEIAEKVKKLIRDKGGNWDEEWRLNLSKELGDVLWYLSEIASAASLNLNDVVETNIDKLTSRKTRGVIGGSGDNR